MSVDTQARLRLLWCGQCRTLEELPWYDGPVERDGVLEYAVSKHSTNGSLHDGYKLYDVEERIWTLPGYRRSIIEQIKGGSTGLAAFDANYYNVQQTLREDALKCYHLHSRPREGCIDWRDDRKLLVPDTRVERKELGLPMPGRGASPVSYLCDFCPVRSYYERKSRGD